MPLDTAFTSRAADGYTARDFPARVTAADRNWSIRGGLRSTSWWIIRP